MKISGWGNYPVIDAQFLSDREIVQSTQTFIPRGNGRSYGDSALAKRVTGLTKNNRLLGFNTQTGVLHCEAGVLLEDILTVFIPRGWFFMVTPGTKLITVGGAVAADVHGKNHHRKGCFSESVLEFKILLNNGKYETCSIEKNRNLFRATCGGMGLTGVIAEVKIQLRKISSSRIDGIVVKTRNLKETFAAFEKYADKEFSVAWIDCLAKDKSIGRSIISFGEHSNNGDLTYKNKFKVHLKFNLPSFLLNPFTVKLFNLFYYGIQKKGLVNKRFDIDSFFYPLDNILGWNKLYGKAGFTQYQFVLPYEKSYDGLMKILQKIAESGMASFLSVLKLMGKANENWLSFPMEGYTLALDFKISKRLFPLLDELDKIVLKYGGRFYLAKDVRLKKETFEAGYEKIEHFRAFRKKYKLENTFRSLQSERVGI
jgi:decaprenylphospho-beta-D-ribofuranose 2-oxidase